MTIAYTHSSTLRTLQEIFGVQPFLGDAANATDLSDLFSDFAGLLPQAEPRPKHRKRPAAVSRSAKQQRRYV